MKKVLVLSVLCFCLVFIGTDALADTKVDVRTGTITEVEASPSTSQQINSKSEAQPPQIQELSFIYPPGLFVNAQDLRNVMDLLKFIHANPCPYRWQLEKWADGGSVDVNMVTTNEKVPKNANDRIAIFLDIEDFYWDRARDPKTGDFLKDPVTGKFQFYRDTENTHYRGAAVGNAKKNTISLQTLAALALEAMDHGHNAIEIRARVIAEEVYGKAKGASIGGGGSGIADKVGVSVPVMLGVSSSKAGKIALDGIQAELYEKKKGVIFEDEAVKIRRQIEKIWYEQKKAVREKKEMENLRAEVEKKKLLVENEELDRKLNPPPVKLEKPAAFLPPQPVVQQAPMIKPCPASLHFEIGKSSPNKGPYAKLNIKEGERMINWMIEYKQEIETQGLNPAIIGGCDEHLIELYKKINVEYAKEIKELINGDKDLAELHPQSMDIDPINPRLGDYRAGETKLFLGKVAKQMGVFDQVRPILRKLAVLSSGKHWLAIPDKPLDGKNRYSILVAIIGGPDKID